MADWNAASGPSWSNGQSHLPSPSPEPTEDTFPDDLDNERTDPISQLVKAWTIERCSPDIMAFEGELVGKIMGYLDAQAKLIGVLKVDGASEEDHEKIGLVQMEMDRVGWLLRSYIATRQEKLMRYTSYINSTPAIQTRLSVAEQTLIESYQQIFEESLIRDVVGNLPEELQALDEVLPDGRSMVSQPDLDKAVFIRAKQDCGPVLMPDGSSLEIKKRGIHLISYRVVEQLVLRGEVELA
ncbi:GINS complex, Sld5 component [Calocera viscosa TUFC12733]|uniref:DNA replication complex GINS protein SLD5 n=1 Tax=Calocera viscosa (strain TUFC12733) TaxID=1330018 RepID=A0A167N6H0_CALVF|nr:GINS complex, Sld5 component [Calocera viscosa TUFC12733]